MTATSPRVSIGVPVYNGERYLAQAVDSLLAQTFEDFEVIICDNASTDRTGEIARTYAEQEARVRYVRNPRNLGAPGNYRRVFEMSRGQYFRWAAADDLSAPQSLARCVEVLDREPAVVLAYPKTRLIDEQGRVISDYEDGLHLQSPRASERFRQVLERLAYCNALYGLMRADVLAQTRLLGDFGAADVVFQAELSLYGTFWEVPEFLFYRRFHPGASSCMNQDGQRAVYYPDNPRQIWMRHWRHLWEYLRAAERAPLGIAEKLLLHLFLARIALTKGDTLARELFDATGQLLADVFR